MKLTVDSSETIIQRVKRDNDFAKALLVAALSAIVDDEPEIARIHLRDIVNGSIGFERLAEVLSKNPKSLHRMLSARGNPSMDNLAAIFRTLFKHFEVDMSSLLTQRAA